MISARQVKTVLQEKIQSGSVDARTALKLKRQFNEGLQLHGGARVPIELAQELLAGGSWFKKMLGFQKWELDKTNGQLTKADKTGNYKHTWKGRVVEENALRFENITMTEQTKQANQNSNGKITIPDWPKIEIVINHSPHAKIFNKSLQNFPLVRKKDNISGKYEFYEAGKKISKSRSLFERIFEYVDHKRTERATNIIKENLKTDDVLLKKSLKLRHEPPADLDFGLAVHLLCVDNKTYYPVLSLKYVCRDWNNVMNDKDNFVAFAKYAAKTYGAYVLPTLGQHVAVFVESKNHTIMTLDNFQKWANLKDFAVALGHHFRNQSYESTCCDEAWEEWAETIKTLRPEDLKLQENKKTRKYGSDIVPTSGQSADPNPDFSPKQQEAERTNPCKIVVDTNTFEQDWLQKYPRKEAFGDQGKNWFKVGEQVHVYKIPVMPAGEFQDSLPTPITVGVGTYPTKITYLMDLVREMVACTF